MASFTINEGTMNERAAEASYYVHEGEFFVFYNDDGDKVLTIAAKLINTIRTDGE